MMDALLKHPVYMFSLHGQTANEVRRFVQGVEGQNSEKRSWFLLADREGLYVGKYVKQSCLFVELNSLKRYTGQKLLKKRPS